MPCADQTWAELGHRKRTWSNYENNRKKESK